MRQEELATLPALVRTYLNYLSAIKNKSMLTVLEYGSDLRLFYRYIAKTRGLCGNDVPFDEVNISMLTNEQVCSVTLDEAYAFLFYCRKERNNDNNSRARKAVAIKRFFRYLEINGHISVNRIAFLESPQTKKSLPKYLTLEQSVKLLQNVDGKFKEVSHRNSLFNTTMISVLTAINIAEDFLIISFGKISISFLHSFPIS